MRIAALVSLSALKHLVSHLPYYFYETVEAQRVSLRDELAQTRDSLQKDSRELRSLVLEELDRHFSILREDKLSKDDLAELLFELGMRLINIYAIARFKSLLRQ